MADEDKSKYYTYNKVGFSQDRALHNILPDRELPGIYQEKSTSPIMPWKTVEIGVDDPKIPPLKGKEDLEGIWESFYGSEKSVWDRVKGGAVKAFDEFIGNTTYPKTWLTDKKSWSDRLIEHFTPDVSPTILPPQGTAKVWKDVVTNQGAAADFASIKLRFPLMSTQNAAYIASHMSAFSYKVDENNTKPLFDHGSPSVAFYNALTAADIYRANYTAGRLSELFEPWLEYENAKKALIPGSTGIHGVRALKHTRIGKIRFQNLMRLKQELQALRKSILDKVKMRTEDTDFKERYNANIMYNLLPYERFRYEAAVKIGDFYLFLDELSEYNETYNYGFKRMETLYASYHYRTGGDYQKITLKATLCYTNRMYSDYFIRLANSKRPLRFITSIDDQKRFILITSLECSYKLQPGRTIFDNPKPAVSNFTIHGDILGDPLPSFDLDHYKNDPSVDMGQLERSKYSKGHFDQRGNRTSDGEGFWT